MSDLIRKRDAVSAISDLLMILEGKTPTWNEVYHAIQALPSADPEEGKWIMHKMLSRDYGKIYYQHDCSCNLYESPYPFCPNCGMKMKRGEK